MLFDLIGRLEIGLDWIGLKIGLEIGDWIGLDWIVASLFGRARIGCCSRYARRIIGAVVATTASTTRHTTTASNLE